MRVQIRWRRWIPIALVLLGGYLSVGCFYVPTFDLPKEGADFRRKVGPADSHREIRPGNATRIYVERVLGQPKYVSKNGLTTYYELRLKDGVWVWPLCFYTDSDYTWYLLTLHFDKDGLLTKYEIEKAQTVGSIINNYSEHSPFPYGRNWGTSNPGAGPIEVPD